MPLFGYPFEIIKYAHFIHIKNFSQCIENKRNQSDKDKFFHNLWIKYGVNIFFQNDCLFLCIFWWKARWISCDYPLMEAIEQNRVYTLVFQRKIMSFPQVFPQKLIWYIFCIFAEDGNVPDRMIRCIVFTCNDYCIKPGLIWENLPLKRWTG